MSQWRGEIFIASISAQLIYYIPLYIHIRTDKALTGLFRFTARSVLSLSGQIYSTVVANINKANKDIKFICSSVDIL